MKKQIIIIATFFSVINFSKAQVGIGTTSPKSTLDVSGSFGMKIDSITTNTTLDATYGIVICKNSSAITISLPAVSSTKGRTYCIKKSGSGNITISPNGTNTIDGSSSLVMTMTNQMVNLVCDGVSKWYVTNNSTANATTPSGWAPSGNSGLNASNSFIGTTDAVDVVH